MDRYISCCLYAGGKDNSWCSLKAKHVSAVHCQQNCVERKETRRAIPDEQLQLFAQTGNGR